MKKIFITIILLIAFMAVNLYADCDMMAMIAKKGHFISNIWGNTGELNKPVEFFDWLRDKGMLLHD